MKTRRQMTVSPLWLQGAVLTFILGFSILGFSAYRIYQDHAPVPERVVDESGKVLFTGQDIREGQEQFLSYGLMQFGTVYGHGAYLGPDFTADYLHRLAVHMIRLYGGDDAARQRTQRELRENRYDAKTKTLTWTEGEVSGFEAIHDHFGELVYGRKVSGEGLKASMITDADDTRKITAFLAWTAWTAVARRPGQNYSYTNNWPPEELVGNHLTGDAIMWSALSLVALLGGIGIVLGLYGRYARTIGWHETEERRIRFVPPSQVPLTPAQRVTAWFFLVVSVLFLLQNLIGGATVHYMVEAGGFFGIDLPRWLPYNLTRTWHLQLAIFFVAAAYLAAGIFLAPLISGREPRGQGLLSAVLLVALAVVVFGSLGGEALSYHGLLPRSQRVFLGAQGWEYLDLGRFWMYLLVVGMFLWLVIVYRGLQPRLATESRGNLPWLFLYSALSIPAFYAVGLLTHSQSTFAIGDFWRFWVVHLWVEDFLELFTTMLVALIFVLMGIVSERFATRLIYFDIMLYSLGGVVGTLHHCYFSGGPAVEMALGAFFSAAEVIPLTLLTVEAWSFLQLGNRQQTAGNDAFPHRWAVLFLASVGFWNFLGAGVFGFLINLPVVSYYEIGTLLTSNHGHAAFMGVYGMLALALLVFCTRYLARPEDWSEGLVRFSFWATNIGLMLMILGHLFPLGVLQLGDVVTNGYWHARSEWFRNYPWLSWARMPGDLVFMAGSAPLVWLTLKVALRTRRSPEPVESTESALEARLYTEVTPAGDEV
ncbi:MAG TPA: cbb3-type cytochrome c oxidase subunit I [Isosphaeraceae bacterium]|nr:cbb3-type cytochrome c oxidase subunit I [Isosphaeraceae bacterium]